MEKILTIVIPSYNVEKYLATTLKSLIGVKRLDSLDIIVVNDGSTDGSGKIAEKFAAEFPYSIRCINKSNGGHGSAINIGLKYARGRFFCVLDGDDWFETFNLDKFLEFVKNRKEDLIVSGHYKNYINKNIQEEFKHIEKSGTVVDVKYFYKKQIMLKMTDACYRTELLRNINLKILENTFYVDEIFCTIPFIGIETIIYSGISFYHYRIGDVNQSISRKNVINRIEDKIKVFKYICEGTENILCDKYTKLYLTIKKKKFIKAILEIYYVFMPNRTIGRQRGNDFCKWLRRYNMVLYKKIYKNIIFFKIINTFHISEKSLNKLKLIICKIKK